MLISCKRLCEILSFRCPPSPGRGGRSTAPPAFVGCISVLGGSPAPSFLAEPPTGVSAPFTALAAGAAALRGPKTRTREELVGLVEIDDGEWDVYFGPLRLGRFHERTLLIEDALGRHYRRPY
jgi:hypothetical protein